MKGPIKIKCGDTASYHDLSTFCEALNIESLISEYYPNTEIDELMLIDTPYLESLAHSELSALKNKVWIHLADDESEFHYGFVHHAVHAALRKNFKLRGEKIIIQAIERGITFAKKFKEIEPKKDGNIFYFKKTSKKYKGFSLESVVAFESKNSNTYILQRNQDTEAEIKKEILSNSLSELEKMLHKESFVRTHKNFIVNLNHLSKNQILPSPTLKLTNNFSAKLSRSKEQAFLEKLQNLR